MSQQYDLAGRAVLAVGPGLDAGQRRTIAAAMDPFAPSAFEAPPDVTVDVAPMGPPPRFTDIHRPAGDATVTAWDGSALYLLEGDAWCRLPDAAASGPLQFVAGPGFPLGRVVRPALRPALQLAVLRRGAAAVHAAAVEHEGGAVLLSGWSETGKTEAALALAERGARFLSDKWTVCGSDGTASAFPISVGIRRWVLPSLPLLRGALPPAARAQLAAAATFDTATRPLRVRLPGRARPRLANGIDRVVALADRAALTQTELREVYGGAGGADGATARVPLRGVVLLRTVPGERVTAETTEPGWAAARLARSAAVERRPWFALRERARYARADVAVGDEAHEWIERERDVLALILAGVPVIAVDAPFPADPRRIADAVLALLA
jgi:hypothetical protein